jgi:hypothetical protein
VERACQDVLRATRALLSEFRLKSDRWPDVSRIFQSVLNNSPSPKRGNIAPFIAFTGREPDSPLRSLVCTVAGEVLCIDAVQARQLIQIDSLPSSVHEIHRKARDSAASSRASARNRQKKPPAVSANFEIGDFVLVAKREFRGGDKLSLRCQGPHRIVATRSDYVYEVEDLITKVVTSIHSTRLRFYHDSSLDVTADILAHLAHQNTGYEVRAFRDLKYDAESKAYYILVSWLGFEEDDNTWESLLQIYEDLPAEVKERHTAVLQGLNSSDRRFETTFVRLACINGMASHHCSGDR